MLKLKGLAVAIQKVGVHMYGDAGRRQLADTPQHLRLIRFCHKIFTLLVAPL